MPTSTAALQKRSRKLKRRFSSASANGAPWNNTFAPLLSAPPSRGRSRQVSTSPPTSHQSVPFGYLRPTLTDSSDVEELSPSSDQDAGPSNRPNHHLFRSNTGQRPMTYASLPPTPISPSPASRPSTPVSPESPLSPVSAAFSSSLDLVAPPFSLWDYLREELLATDFDSHQELKWERVSNFLSIPLAMEKVCLPQTWGWTNA